MDLGCYSGAKPYLSPTGIYRPVFLESFSGASLCDLDVDYTLSQDYSSAKVAIEISGCGHEDNSKLILHIIAPDKTIVASLSQPLLGEKNEWAHAFNVNLSDNLELWYPVFYGNQPLYTVRATLENSNGTSEHLEKIIGFREIIMKTPFDFMINGQFVKLWGTNMVPINGVTHVWDEKRGLKLLELAAQCNMNTLRMWGGGDYYGDEFYNECDRRGILIWSEFMNSWSMRPDDDEYRKLCKLEAQYMVKTLRHHPCVFMWCGGNEAYLGAETDWPNQEIIGGCIFEDDYRDVCAKLDNQRFYYSNSPSLGAFANDPSAGDMHGWNKTWFIPGELYPVLNSEVSRVSIPALKTMERYFGKDNLWPEGFVPTVRKPGDCMLPDNWMIIKTGPDELKTCPTEQFFDAHDARSLIYKFGAAHGMFLKNTIERARRGRPSSSPDGNRITKGLLVWKHNDTLPQIFSALIDYELETYIPYFATKRAFSPQLVSFDIGNNITAWVTNDTSRRINGSLEIGVFDTENNVFIRRKTCRVIVESGKSEMICSLDDFCQFKAVSILHARLLDDDGILLCETFDYTELERNLVIPQAKITAHIDGNELVLTTDCYARCVELTGIYGDNAFGFVFSDNYFDMLPNFEKRVTISGHTSGEITIAPYYSSHTTKVIMNVNIKS